MTRELPGSEVKHLEGPLVTGCTTGHKSCPFNVGRWDFSPERFLTLQVVLTTLMYLVQTPALLYIFWLHFFFFTAGGRGDTLSIYMSVVLAKKQSSSNVLLFSFCMNYSKKI